MKTLRGWLCADGTATMLQKNAAKTLERSARWIVKPSHAASLDKTIKDVFSKYPGPISWVITTVIGIVFIGGLWITAPKGDHHAADGRFRIWQFLNVQWFAECAVNCSLQLLFPLPGRVCAP